jgi:hypothetical protein
LAPSNEGAIVETKVRDSQEERVQTYQQTRYMRLGRSAITAFSVIAFLMFLAAPLSGADDRAKCQRSIEKAEARLDDAIAKHGEHSHEANARRHDLVAERQACWNRYHQWWDGKEHKWHDDQNWEIEVRHEDHQP